MRVEDLSTYEIIEKRQIPDINSVTYLCRHKKTGARVALVSNDDENKVFYIGFRTTPKDSTGVAHILEHSVLCGSKEFPVKDPFVELVKGSLNTFLNAMTYPDKTVYPVASCNDKDFQNLMHVYLDAVFYPNIYKNESIFRQEGWHYELEGDNEELKVNGVVYNEMKGAFSSPDDVLEREIMNSLYPHTTYGCESGGDPEAIPELTYEEFLRLAALFAKCGVDTVRVTGGEPLVRKGVDYLVAQLKAIPGIRRVTMTTNGVLLAKQLPALLSAGLDSVNISLDTLDPAVFRHITARDEFAAVQAGLRAALESPLPVKLNCVPQVGVNEGELEAIAALARDNDLQVRFIEMMPIGYGAAMPCVSGPELRARFANRWPELHPVEGTTFGNGPAVYYTVPGWKGSIGFIAAVHGKFCASCNRVRLTSQGFLRPCLASESGTDLRALLRSGADDAALLQAIQNTILAKPREHHFGQGSMPATRGMYRIGG